LTPEEQIKFLENQIKQKNKTIERLKLDRTIITKRGEFEEVISKVGEETVFKRIDYSKRNPSKVTLARIGKVEIFCYPYSNFSKIFLGFGSKAIEITKYDLPKLLGAYNKGRWFIENGKNVVNDKFESTSELAQQVRLAYIYANELELSKTKEVEIQKNIKLLEYVHGMKPDKREKWFQEEEGLREQYEEWLKNQS
jgi:hypothetical protein